VSELHELATRDLGQGAVRGEQLARDLDGVLAAAARAELKSEQLGVGQRGRTIEVETLARPLVLRPHAHRHIFQ
jgi:hypothetical protein